MYGLQLDLLTPLPIDKPIEVLPLDRPIHVCQTQADLGFYVHVVRSSGSSVRIDQHRIDQASVAVCALRSKHAA